MPQIVEEALLVFVQSDANSNKFYRLRLNDDDTVDKLWGRVRKGATTNLSGQSQTEAGGKRKFDSIFTAKTKKGYRKVDVVETVAASTVSGLHATAAASLGGGSADKVVTTLIDRLIAANKHTLMASTGGMISVDTTGQARTALGVISAAAVADARTLLGRVAATADPKARGQLTEQYLSIVPHDIPVRLGAGWAPTWLGELTTEEKQRELLDALDASASFAAAARKNTAGGEVDEDFFRYRVTRLDPTDPECQMVLDRFERTKQAVHASASRTPKYVYRLEDRRHGAEVATIAEKVRNIQRLWHGTGAANVLSILQKGLFVPPTNGSGIHIAGRMFGDGVYLSRSATKSLNYSTGFWGGGTSGASAFLFLTRAAMGYEYRPIGNHGRTRFARPDADANGKRYDSVNVLPENVPGIRNHEAIVTDPMQVGLSWLVEF